MTRLLRYCSDNVRKYITFMCVMASLQSWVRCVCRQCSGCVKAADISDNDASDAGDSQPRRLRHKTLIREPVKYASTYLQPLRMVMNVEYYLYPTVFTAFIRLIKPGLTKQDKIELGRRSNWVVYVCARQLAVRRRIAYKIFINKQIQHIHK